MYSFKDALKKGGTVRKLLPLVVAGVPWFLKDQLAADLEQQAREAQQVLAKMEAQEAAEQQSADLRELNGELHAVEENILKAQGNVLTMDGSAQAKAFASLGRNMGRSAASLENFKFDIALTPGDSRELDNAVESATRVAKKLDEFGGWPPEAQRKAVSELEAESGEAFNGLSVVYEKVYTQALTDQKQSAVAAKRARNAAWIFTFVAALMMKDWAKAKDMAVDAMSGKREDDADDGEAKPAAGETA